MTRAKVINFLVPFWLALYASMTWAADTTKLFKDDARAYDWESLLWAAAFALLAGSFRTILTLTSEKSMVLDILKVTWKDLIVSLIAGMVAFVVLQGVGSAIPVFWPGFHLPREFRMLIIMAAGWTRMGFFGKLDYLAMSAVLKIDSKLGNRNKLPGQSLEPPIVMAPTSPPPKPPEPPEEPNPWAKTT
jgi:hypothetical protein